MTHVLGNIIKGGDNMSKKTNNYTYEELRYFLDYLMLPELCDGVMPKEECAKETINLIDYFTFDSWTKWKATEIITKRINIISALFYIDSIN